MSNDTNNKAAVTMKFDRSTKRTHLYQVNVADLKGLAPVTDSFYASKNVVGEKPPETIKVTVEW